MKNKRKVLVGAGVVLSALAVQSAPLVGKAVGKVVGRAVAREATELAAERAATEGATRTMNSALAGVSAKQLMGAGVGVGVAAAIPLGTYKLSDGRQELDKARAEAIRTESAAVTREMAKDPALVRHVIEARSADQKGALDRLTMGIERMLPWLSGLIGGGCLLFLFGFLLRAIGYVRNCQKENV